MLKRILGFLLIVALTAALLVVGERGAPADEENAAGLRAVQDKTTVLIFDGNRPVLRYRYQGVAFKPYVDQLFSPAGVQILRDSAPDHKHHHGLMYALSVDGVNFWEEATVEAGTERHRRIDTARYFAPDSVWSAGLVEDIDWVASTSDKPLLVERRQIDVLEDQGRAAPDSGATLVHWRCRLAAPPGKESMTLTGHHYFGLGMRFVPSMDKGGRFFNADDKPGEDGPNGCRLVRTRWCAYTAKADGKPVTVALFDDPANFRHPQTMFTLTRGFAYLAATMNEWKEPVIVKAGQPLELRYGVAVWDGEVDKVTVEKLYRRWVKLGDGESKK